MVATARCGCTSAGCSCVLTALDTDCINTTVTGSGSLADPYVISAVPTIDTNAGNMLTCETTGLRADLSAVAADTNCIDMTVTGAGTPASPLTISAAPIIDPVVGNQLSCGVTGLLVSAAAAVHTHDGTGGGTSLVVGGVNEGGATIPTATSLQSIAIGDFASASIGTQPIAIGSGTNTTSAPQALAQGAIAIGASNGAAITGPRATAASSIAIGSGTAVVVGALASGDSAVAFGTETLASGLRSVALGYSAAASGISAFAGGDNALASNDFAVALGPNTIASGLHSVALGNSAAVSGISSFAGGDGAVANHNNAVALGDGVSTTNTGQVNIGAKKAFIGAPNAITADADLINNQLTFYVDEANNTLTIKVKYSTGTVKTFIGALA